MTNCKYDLMTFYLYRKENPLVNQLGEVTAYMKRLELIENAPKDLKKGKSGKAWTAFHLKDKFGFQQMVDKRKKALAPEMNPVDAHAPTEAPTLEDEIKERTDDLRTLDQIIMQPLINISEPLLPVQVPLAGRVQVRCDECERTLIKRDFGVTTFKFKISVSSSFNNNVKSLNFSHLPVNLFLTSECLDRLMILKLGRHHTYFSLLPTYHHLQWI